MRAEVVDMSADVVSFAEEFIGYIRSTYMNGAFGNEDDGWEWNAFERVEDVFLTNNPSEGANNRLRKRRKGSRKRSSSHSHRFETLLCLSF